MNHHTEDSENHPDHETHSNHPGSFLAGALLGGLAGAGAMLLLAPQSGRRTRAQIQLKGIELRDQATEAVEDGMLQTRVKARQVTADIREKAKEIQHSGQDLLAEQKARLSAVVAAGKPASQGAQHVQV
jgi:gas vesicle protein